MNKNVSRRSFVTGATGAGAFAALAGLAGCNQKKDDGGQKASGEKKKKLTMVTDTGGVNDQSFNQSAWEGMTELKDKNGWDVSYLESKQDSDYATNLDKAVDAESDLVWGVGFAMADATLKAAKDNPNTQFAIIDNGNDSQVSNFTGVMFRAQEPSFVVGYIAARTTKTGKVGFVGGISSALIDQFEYGYRGGVAYANKEKGTNVEISAQYAESFSEQSASLPGSEVLSKAFFLLVRSLAFLAASLALEALIHFSMIIFLKVSIWKGKTANLVKFAFSVML